jgi:hypothetical protein
MDDNDEIEREWMDQATIAFQALRLSEGDIVVVNLPDNIAYEQMQQVAEMVSSTLPVGIAALVLTDGITISKMSEEEMNLLGWQRITRH